jgi:threonine/homoserine/homoserine lactone efflux protein
MDYYLQGILLGFAIAAPVGPIGVLCIRRTLAEGRGIGLVSGLGAATADAFYGFVGGFGLTFVSSFLIEQQAAFRLVGGLFLLYLGIKTLLARPAPREGTAPSPSARIQPDQAGGFLAAYFSTLFLTLSNPATILSFAAIFAGAGLVTGSHEIGAAFGLVLGVFSGSALWWLLLSSLVSVFRKRVSDRGLVWVNRLSGILITGFGLAALGSLIW